MDVKCAAETSYRGGRARSWRADRETEPGCRRLGKVQIHGRWYCRQHAPIWKRLWAEHDRVLERIRSFPNRGIE